MAAKARERIGRENEGGRLNQYCRLGAWDRGGLMQGQTPCRLGWQGI